MIKNNSYLMNILKYVITLIILTGISLVVHLMIYRFKFNYVNVSNSLFISNILIFFLSLAVNIGAGNIFNPLRYAIKKVFSLKNKSENPVTYGDYVEEKKKEIKNFWFLTIATINMLLIAFILTLL